MFLQPVADDAERLSEKFQVGSNVNGLDTKPLRKQGNHATAHTHRMQSFVRVAYILVT